MQIQRLHFSLHGGQADINALGLPLLPVRQRTARAHVQEVEMSVACVAAPLIYRIVD